MLRTIFDEVQNFTRKEVFTETTNIFLLSRTKKNFPPMTSSCCGLPKTNHTRQYHTTWKSPGDDEETDNTTTDQPPRKIKRKRCKGEMPINVFKNIKYKLKDTKPTAHLQPIKLYPNSPKNISQTSNFALYAQEKCSKVNPMLDISLRRGYTNFREDSHQYPKSLSDKISIHPLCCNGENKTTSCLEKPWPSFSETISINDNKSSIKRSHSTSLVTNSKAKSLQTVSRKGTAAQKTEPNMTLIKYDQGEQIHDNEDKSSTTSVSKRKNKNNYPKKDDHKNPLQKYIMQPWISYSDFLKAQQLQNNKFAMDIQSNNEKLKICTSLAITPIHSLPEIPQKRLLTKNFDFLYNKNAKSIKQYKRHIATTPIFFKKKKKYKKCFLPSKVRLRPITKCTPFPKLCPKKDPCIRADDFLCVIPKRLRKLEENDCICHEPYVPTRAPKLRRMKFFAPDPPRICPPPPCPKPRADDNLRLRQRQLRVLPPNDCECIDPEPLEDVPLKRLKKVCPPEVCRPKKVCPKKICPPRADRHLKPKKKHLPILRASDCPCIEETITDVPRIKRLNLKFPEQPRPCLPPPPCVRADDCLVLKRKHLPYLQAKDCPKVETEMVDVNFKRLKCREYEEPCFKEDPCKTNPPRADMGCWEYIVCRKPKSKKKDSCDED